MDNDLNCAFHGQFYLKISLKEDIWKIIFFLDFFRFILAETLVKKNFFFARSVLMLKKLNLKRVKSIQFQVIGFDHVFFDPTHRLTQQPRMKTETLSKRKKKKISRVKMHAISGHRVRPRFFWPNPPVNSTTPYENRDSVKTKKKKNFEGEKPCYRR